MTNRRDAVVAASLFAASIVYSFSYCRYGMNLLDEGYLVDPVMRVLDGQVPYRDFYSFYPPGSFYLFAALFKLFGRDLLVVRAGWVLLHGALAALAYLVARRFASPLYAVIPAVLISFAPGPWYKTFVVLLPFLCLWFYFMAFKKGGPRWAAAAGAATGASLLFRQDVAIYAGLTFLAVSLLRARVLKVKALGPLVSFCAASALPVALAALYWWSKDALAESVRQVFLAGAPGIRSATIDFPPLFPFWAGGLPKTLSDKLFYLPFAVYALAWYHLASRAVRRGLSDEDTYFAAALLLGTLDLAQVKSRSDIAHLWQALPLVLVIAYALLYRLSSRCPGRPLCAAAAVIGLLLGAWVVDVALQSGASGSVAVARGMDYRLSIPGAEVYVPRPDGVELEELVRYVQGASGNDEYIFAVPDISLLYFLTGKKNPGYFEHYFKGISSPAQYQDRVIGELASKGVRVVVVNKLEVSDSRPDRLFANHSPKLYGYIADNYRKVYETGRFEVLRLKGGAP